MGLLAELRRRKVVRAAVVYAAGAFAALQAADLVLPRLGVPDSVMTGLVVMALLGAPVAVALSWAFDWTAGGIIAASRTEQADPSEAAPALLGRRSAALALALVLLGAGLGAGWFLKPAEPAAAARGPGAPVAIAVLPFSDVAGDAERSWFADGLTEEILNRLAGVPGLRVAGRTSSFHFRGHDEDLRVIGARLGVTHLLEGTVRRADRRLRITARLVAAEDGLHLWSDAYDRELDDVFAIQDEIARAIAGALEVELGGGAARAVDRTASLPAYERYLEALTLIARRGDEAMARAIELLEEAVRLDPEFAPAWGSLAQAHALHRYYGGELAASLERAERAARRALELDPSVARAHVALGDVLRDRHRWLDAEASYRRALELNPDDVEANSQYAQMLTRLGHTARALPFARRAAELDPVSALHQGLYGLFLFWSGERETGMLQVEHARRLDPGLRIIHRGYVTLLIETGRIAEAALEQEALDRSIPVAEPSMLRGARLPELVRAGRPEAALAHLRADAPPEQIAALNLWHWAVHLGDPELALAYITAEREIDHRLDATWVWAQGLAPVRRLPGFARLVEQLDLPAYWNAHGWPPACRPRAGGGVICE